jgi:predicted MFS family arabinose efflux permease
VLAGFGMLRSSAPAYFVGAVLGYAYFIVITSLSTVLQEHLEDHVRGRVMALWIMGFGGTVPVGVLVGGWIAEHSPASITHIVLAGCVWALVLAWWSQPRRLREKGAADVGS